MRKSLADRSADVAEKAKRHSEEKIRQEFILPKHLVARLRYHATIRGLTTGRLMAELISRLPKEGSSVD